MMIAQQQFADLGAHEKSHERLQQFLRGHSHTENIISMARFRAEDTDAASNRKGLFGNLLAPIKSMAQSAQSTVSVRAYMTQVCTRLTFSSGWVQCPS